jgi:hypothetical protein
MRSFIAGATIRRGGSDQVGIGVLGELEVPDRVVAQGLSAAPRRGRPQNLVAWKGSAGRVTLELVGEYGGADDSLEGRGADEATGGRRHHHTDAVPGLGREARQLERLVGGNPAADPEEDPAHASDGTAGRQWSAGAGLRSFDRP